MLYFAAFLSELELVKRIALRDAAPSRTHDADANLSAVESNSLRTVQPL